MFNLPATPDTELSQQPRDAAWREFARAPLVPVALAVTTGLILDRYGDVPAITGWVLGVVGLVLWSVGRARGAATSVVWLWVAVAGLGAIYHNLYRNHVEPNDISQFATEIPTPARIRGIVVEEPVRHRPPRNDPFVTEQLSETTSTVLTATEIHSRDGWVGASGRIRVSIEGLVTGIHTGDRVEMTGRLVLPAVPANPGETNWRELLLNQRITASLRVEKSITPVTRLEEGWRRSLFGWLSVIRGWGTRTFQQLLPEPEAGLAGALLLGDRTALDREEWQAFVRTGVVHVLAISGQHLVILAMFIWLVLKVFDVRRRRGAGSVALVMIGYALLTGARPSAVRAAIMVCTVCAALILRRPVMAANAFALAWIVVVAINPTDPFTIGCQLSFVSVFVLSFAAPVWLAPRSPTPVEQLLAEYRTFGEQLARSLGRGVWVATAISFILAVVNAPLILAWQNLVAPIGVILGPPVVLLSSIALISGFLLLLAAPISAWLAWPLARVTEWSLAACEALVRWAVQIPGAWVYGPSPSTTWLIGFYSGVIALVLLPTVWQRRILIALAVWVILGLVVSLWTRETDELRVTILAVGHGGCVVIETPDNRVLLYDVGTTRGPDTVRRVIAPYLWQRGITRIDEVFLSHADLDHFNGLPELLERFPIGRVTHTPTFADKTTRGVETVLDTLDRRGIARRIAVVGERFEAGAVTLEVLHPPSEGPAGNENTRSLVLLVRSGTNTILLTGDLEGEGQAQVRLKPIPAVDVMLAPHHGGKSANAPQPGPGNTLFPGLMAQWAKPKLVISSQRPGPTDHLAGAYGGVGAIVWDTPTAGAVTVRCHSSGVITEAFRTGEVRVVARRK